MNRTIIMNNTNYQYSCVVYLLEIQDNLCEERNTNTLIQNGILHMYSTSIKGVWYTSWGWQGVWLTFVKKIITTLFIQNGVQYSYIYLHVPLLKLYGVCLGSEGGYIAM